MNQNYIDTVRLLLAVAPAVFQPPRFAMKGGTALNLFVQAIGADLKAVKSALSAMGYRPVSPGTKSGDDVKLLVEAGGIQIKVEVNAQTRMQQRSTFLLGTKVVRTQEVEQIALGLIGEHLDEVREMLSLGGKFDPSPLAQVSDLHARGDVTTLLNERAQLCVLTGCRLGSRGAHHRSSQGANAPISHLWQGSGSSSELTQRYVQIADLAMP